MKASELIERVQRLVDEHGDQDVLMDVDLFGPYPVGEVGIDVDDTGIILWKEDDDGC